MLSEKNLDFTAQGSEWRIQKAAGSEVYWRLKYANLIYEKPIFLLSFDFG